MTAGTESVAGPSSRDETLSVARVAMAVAATAYLAAAMRAAPAGAGDGVLPYQVRFRDLPPPVQRLRGLMAEGLAEIEIRYDASGRFPDPTELAGEGIPPFAPDPLARPPLSWTLEEDANGASYLGAPRGPGDAFLLRLEPGAPGDASHAPGAARDEGHRVLPGGSILHVSFWTRRGAPDGPRMLASPARDGWTQMIVGQTPPEVPR